jgi:molybdopterin synthase catalytic subunit
MSDRPVKIAIQHEPFDTRTETELLTRQSGNVGALVSFSGICRADETLSALELEHYPGMAEAQIGRIVDEAFEKWPILGALVIHRIGKIPVGDEIVLVAVTSAHRHAAFDGANYIMDFLKSRAPFWKKEHLAGGSEGAWVDAKESDEDALSRWVQEKDNT